MFFLVFLQKNSELCSELNLLIMLQKTFFYFLTALLIVGSSLDARAQAASIFSDSDDDHMRIVVQPRGDVSPRSPRMPSAIRIEAFYDEAVSAVCSYLTNAGTSVDVVLSNVDTGETMSCSIPGSGFSVIPISGTSGVWILTYTLYSGKVYEGSFIL